MFVSIVSFLIFSVSPSHTTSDRTPYDSQLLLKLFVNGSLWLGPVPALSGVFSSFESQSPRAFFLNTFTVLRIARRKGEGFFAGEGLGLLAGTGFGFSLSRS